MPDNNKLLLDIEKNKNEIIGFLKDLIRINSSTGNELEAQDFLREKFREMNLRIKKDFPDYRKIEQSPHYRLRGMEEVLLKDKKRYNLIIDSGKNSKLLIFSHIDTHPNMWKNALAPKVVNNQLIGLGSGDNKSGITIMHSVIKFLLQNNMDVNVKLASTISEEKMGYEGILSCLLNGLEAEKAIYPHGQFLKDAITLGHIGWLIVKIKEADNEKIVNMNSYLKNLSLEIRKNNKIITPDMEMKKLPEKSLRTNKSLEDYYSVTLLPNADIEKIKSRIKNEFNADFSNNPLSNCLPSSTDRNNEIVKTLEDSFNQLKIPVKHKIQKSGSDMRWTNLFDIPTVSFGPDAGNFHREKEYVNLKDLIRSVKILALAILKQEETLI